MKRATPWKVFCICIAVLVCVAIAFPVLWMLPSAFKGQKEIFTVPVRMFPKTWTLENFRNVFKLNELHLASSLLATLGVSASAVVLSLLINMCAAYGFARFNFPFKGVVWWIIIVTMFIPGITILLTSVRVVGALGMIDTFAVLLIPGLASAYNIFFFRQFFLGFPAYLEEAPVIDGLNRTGVFFRIFLPLSVTPMVIIGAAVFMGYWNSFLWPTMTIIQNTNLIQIMQFIKMLNSAYGNNNYGVVIAAAILSMIVPLAIFAFVQKYIMQGINISGLK